MPDAERDEDADDPAARKQLEHFAHLAAGHREADRLTDHDHAEEGVGVRADGGAGDDAVGKAHVEDTE